MSKIRVLVVDDSVVVRKVVSEELGKQPDIEVVGSASNGQIALARMTQYNPDLVVLDIEMPEMDGLTALRKMRESHPKTHVIMFSTLTERGAKETLEALSLGASDYFPKPTGTGSLEESQRVLREQLVPSIRALCQRKTIGTIPPAPATFSARPVSKATRVDILAIGSSTGGPNALADIFAALPANFPLPIVVTQHMPPMFTKLLAERLAKNSPIPTVEARSGDELLPGRAWVAPGDFHLTVVRDGPRVRIALNQEPHENSCRPAVDPMFRSVATLFGGHVLGVVLTGMGQDGHRGAQAVVGNGGHILAQDEASSVVWGMPGFVAKAGLADKVLPLSEMAGEIIRRARIGRA